MTETQAKIQPYVPGVYAIREHPEVARLRAMVDELAEIGGDPGAHGVLVDAHRIDLLRQIEEIKGAAAAAQARVTVEFEASQLAQQDAHGVRRNVRGRGIADQVALARGCPASQGARHLGFAKAMAEMPYTMALLTRGSVDEWTATVLVRETAILSVEDRQTVDEQLCALSLDTATGEIAQPWVLGLTPRRVEGATERSPTSSTLQPPYATPLRPRAPDA